MDESLFNYFIQETNKKLAELTKSVSKNSKDIAMLLQDHHVKNTHSRLYHFQKYGIPAGIATGIVLAREVILLFNS